MIGVISKPEDAEVVGEFFELFKTPWEHFRPGQAYDVVISSTSDLAAIEAKLLIVCRAAASDLDSACGFVPQSRHDAATVEHGGTHLPIYGDVLTFAAGSSGAPFITAKGAAVGLSLESDGRRIVRVGYDIFQEVRTLLTKGQPVEHAPVPTLDLHIQYLREWILNAGIPLLEITPTPFGHGFSVCLTHDIDFAGIRRHFFDHTMLGFVYRATAGAILETARGRLSFLNLLRCWWAVASLPLVYAGLIKDFWDPFEWYLEVEAGLPATYFLIPFKRTPGQKVPGPHALWRAAAYDVADLAEQTSVLLERNYELGVHGIDSWHSADKGREELSRVSAVSGKPAVGIRMHWLLGDSRTPATLEKAGYAYDSTCGYNETVGYRAGTSQVFRPLGAKKILELPMHIQDGALFYPNRLNLTSAQAESRCRSLVEHAGKSGGVLTLLWHDRSHAPERFWGAFYQKLVRSLRSKNAWFGSGLQVVNWFSKRRQVTFESNREGKNLTQLGLSYQGERIEPPLTVRVHLPGPIEERSIRVVDIPCDGSKSDIAHLKKTVRELESSHSSAMSESTFVRSSL